MSDDLETLRRWRGDITLFVKEGLRLSISPAQETLLRAIYALPLSADQAELYFQCTGRTELPAAPFSEVTVVVGARGGKDSRIATPMAIFEAVFGGHEKQLSKGERAVIPIVATDFRGGKIAFSYVLSYITGSPLLSTMVESVLSNEIVLTNRVTISCFPCTLRSLRGWSIPVGLLDELGFFRLAGSANSDVEVQASIRRGMIGFPNTKLIKISTPYMRGGVLYDDFKAGWGVNNPDLLVWKASSTLMNPTLVNRLEREKRLDPLRYAREYEAEFAEDIEAFLPAAWVDAAMVSGRFELPPRDKVTYYAAVDPSGGGADAFTFCVVHLEGQGENRKVVQDVIKGWRRTGTTAPDLTGVVREIASILKRYHLSTVIGDRYSGAWVRQAFSAYGISYRITEVDKSEAYLEVEPLFAQGRIELLDHEIMSRELKALERKPRPGGKIVVDHPSRLHDDHANVMALAAFVSVHSRPGILDFMKALAEEAKAKP